MSNRNSQTTAANTSNAVLTTGSSTVSNQLAAAPAVVAAGAVAREVAKLALKYGRRYLPTIGAGVAAGAGFGFSGLDPNDATAVAVAKAGSWQAYQKLNPRAAAQPGAKLVFDASFTAGVHAGYAARNLVSNNNNQNPSTSTVAIANELKSTLGPTAATSFSQAVANNSQGADAQQSIAAKNTSVALRA
jgi:hypothetical protein